MDVKSGIIGGEIFGKGGGGGTPATWATLTGKPFSDVDPVDFEVKNGYLQINHNLQTREERLVGNIDNHYLYEKIDNRIPPYAVITEEHPMLNYTNYKYFKLNEGLDLPIRFGHLEPLMDTYIVRSDEMPPNFYEDISERSFNLDVVSSGCGGIIYSRNKINFDNVGSVVIDFTRRGDSWNQTYLAIVKCDPREIRWDDWVYTDNNQNITVLREFENNSSYERRYVSIPRGFRDEYLVLFSGTTRSVDETKFGIKEMGFIFRDSSDEFH